MVTPCEGSLLLNGAKGDVECTLRHPVAHPLHLLTCFGVYHHPLSSLCSALLHLPNFPILLAVADLQQGNLPFLA